jgi:hypothetical protein
VDPDHGVPLLGPHVHEHAVAEDPGVIHQGVEAPEVLHRRLDEMAGGVEVGHVVAVGDRFSPERPDHLHDGIGRSGGTAGPVHGDAQVVHHHPGTQAGALERFGPADAVPGAGDDDDPTFAQPRHRGPTPPPAGRSWPCPGP